MVQAAAYPAPASHCLHTAVLELQQVLQLQTTRARSKRRRDAAKRRRQRQTARRERERLAELDARNAEAQQSVVTPEQEDPAAGMSMAARRKLEAEQREVAGWDQPPSRTPHKSAMEGGDKRCARYLLGAEYCRSLL